MICPKCQNLMNTVDRRGVHIDQCESCRGIFLDRGELEQIVRAEERHYSAPPPPYQPEPGHGTPPPMKQMGRPDSPAPHYRGRPDSPPPHYRHGYPDSPRPYGGHHKKRKRRSFLEELFD